jgi:GAF domain-containing protein
MTIQYPGAENEASRLAALYSYELLDSEAETAFNEITTLCTGLFEVPIALISLVDAERQWFKSCKGLQDCSTSCHVSFCTHAVAEKQTLVVTDTHQDSRFKQNALVTGKPRIRFYAGALLTTPEGFGLGTLCIIDTVPRIFSASQQRSLEHLAALVMHLITMRIAARKQQQMAQEIARRKEHLKLFSEIALKIRESLSMPEILTMSVMQVQRLLNADRVVAYQFNQDGGGQIVSETVALGYASLMQRNMVDTCFSNEYLSASIPGRHRAIHDITTAQIHPCYRGFLEDLGVQASLVIPIFKNNQLWGLLIAHQCSGVRQWLDFEVELLIQLADQLGIALVQAQLQRFICAHLRRGCWLEIPTIFRFELGLAVPSNYAPRPQPWSIPDALSKRFVLWWKREVC